MKKKKGNTGSERIRNFFLTCNNPLDHGWSQEKLIQKAKEKGEDLIYYVISDEIGLEKKTPHTHFFFCYKNKKSLDKARQDFPNCDVEEMYSTFSDCRNYVLKEGKYKGSEKEDTRVEGTQQEWGTIPRDRKKSLTYEQIETKLQDGVKVEEILTEMGIVKPQIEQGVKNYDMRLKDRGIPTIKEQKVFVHLGDCKNYVKNKLKTGLDDWYLVQSYLHPWDTYQGQKILLLDRYKGQLAFSEFLTVIDNIKVELSARYHNKKSLWTEVHIVCNWTFENILFEMVHRDKEVGFDINEVLEKITSFIYHFKKNGKNCTIEIPAREFLFEQDLMLQSEAIEKDASIIEEELFYIENEPTE